MDRSFTVLVSDGRDANDFSDVPVIIGFAAAAPSLSFRVRVFLGGAVRQDD